MSMTKQLEQLCSEAFESAVCFVSTASAMRVLIRDTPEVRFLSGELAGGRLTELAIETFAKDLLASFRKGERYGYDNVFAAIAVLLESHPGDFADKFLHDLAALRSSEMPMATRMARHCLTIRVRTVAHSTVGRPIGKLPEHLPVEFKPINPVKSPASASRSTWGSVEDHRYADA
jgi:hypothetical protein